MNSPGTVLITGGTGLIGKAITKALLDKNYAVVILTRDPANIFADAKIIYAKWDIEKEYIDMMLFQKRIILFISPGRMWEIKMDREKKKRNCRKPGKSSELLIKTLSENANKVKAVISASAIGWYGPDKLSDNESFSETDPAHNDFLGETCVQWERSISTVTKFNKRLVILRTGIVLSNEAGALPEFKKPLSFGLATILGTGRQIISWIHIEDL